MWNILKTEADIGNLLNEFGYFHDGCIKEMRYLSGAYVKPNLSMMPITNKRILSIIFQRQFQDPTVIEVEFSRLVRLNLLTCDDDNYTSTLFEICMFLENGLIYWGESPEFKDERENYKGIWICAEEAKWRVADGYIGKEEVFIHRSV